MRFRERGSLPAVEIEDGAGNAVEIGVRKADLQLRPRHAFTSTSDQARKSASGSRLEFPLLEERGDQRFDHELGVTLDRPAAIEDEELV